MRSFFESWLVATLLALLLGLEVLRSCQLDRIEARLVSLEARSSAESAPAGASRNVASPGAEGRGAAAADGTPAWLVPAAGDGTNLLVPLGRPWLKARAVARGGTLRVDAQQDPKSLNPWTGSGADLAELDRYVHARLAARHPDDPERWIPELAVHVTTLDGGRSHVVTLRPGVTWQLPPSALEDERHAWLRAPRTVTSDDFAFAFALLADARIGGRVTMLRGGFEALDGIDVLDPLRFRVRWKAPRPNNLAALLDLSPAPRWLYTADEDGRPLDDATWVAGLPEHWLTRAHAVGVGPYRFVRWTPGVAIELERSPSYFGEPPSFDRLRIQIVKDQAALPRLLRTGELDLVRLQPAQWRTEVLEARGPILGDPAIRAVQSPELGYVFIGWNQARPQLRDARVRRALTHALDRARLVSSIFAGLGTPISGPFPRQQPCYDASIAPLPYDLDAARRLLDEAGWRDTDGDGVRDALVDGARVALEFGLLTYASSAEWDAVSSLYQSALASIGVRMRPEPAEWSVMLQRLDARAFDAHVGVWVVSWEVDLSPIWHSSEADKPKSLNRIAFKDAETDRLLDALRVEVDDAARVRLCHQLHARLHAEQPYTFIYQRDRAFAYRAPLNPPELQPIWPHRDLRFLSFAAPRP